MLRAKMEPRWANWWQRVGAQGPYQRALFVDLDDKYDEPHRAYHTFAHIEQCLDELDQVRHLANAPDCVEYALWYHDVVYVVKAVDNEEKSAAHAIRMGRVTSLTDQFLQTAADLILATKHVAIPSDPDARLLVDIDLSIFGQSPERFDQYDRNIRWEHEWVPAQTYAERRKGVLRSFLDRPAIYLTQHFHEKYELQARQNLERAIARL